MIKTIIFDVGGTLVGGPCLFELISNEINKFHDVDIKKEFKEEFQIEYHKPKFQDVKTIFNLITKRILKKYGKDPLFDIGKVYSNICINHAKLYDETLEILDYLKEQKIKLLVVSDADSDVLMPELERLKITHYFDKVIISSDICCYKTSKEIVSKIMPYLNSEKEEILFVGDSDADINTAKNLGVKSVFINRKNDLKKGDKTIKSLLELKEMIK